MPLYEYQCTKCERRVEKIQKFSDPPRTKCDYCGGKLKQLISSPAIRFKGSGFYINDYARGSASGGRDSSPDSTDGAEKKAKETGKTSEPAKAESGKTAEPAKTSSSKTSEAAKPGRSKT